MGRGEAHDAGLGVDELRMQTGEVGGQPHEGDVHVAGAEGGGLAAPVEALGLDADVGVGAGELGAGPGGELPGAAGLEADPQDAGLPAPVPVGDGGDAGGLPDGAAGLGDHVASGGGGVTPPGCRSKRRRPSSVSSLRSA